VSQHSVAPTDYPDVNSVLGEVLSGAQRALDDHFVGMYLDGSLAIGGSSPTRATSTAHRRRRVEVGQRAGRLVHLKAGPSIRAEAGRSPVHRSRERARHGASGDGVLAHSSLHAP
jgi:hypothetical protein